MAREIRHEMFKKLPTEVYFVYWQGRSPIIKVEGNSLSPTVENGQCDRNIKNSQLGQFFRRIDFKKGRKPAIIAQVRKLALIIWKMMVHRVPYCPP